MLPSLLPTATKSQTSLKKVYNCKTDGQLSVILKLSPSTLSNWRQRQSMDFIHVLKFIPENLDLNWLFRGILIGSQTEIDKEKKIVYLEAKIKELKDTIHYQETEIKDTVNELTGCYSKIEVLQDTLLKFNKSRQTGADVQDLPDKETDHKNRGKLVEN